MSSKSTTLDVEKAVTERYKDGARERQPQLCCPVDYDPSYLKIIPDEIIEKDYGCGDPSKYIREGETVLDLGSGGGKICYIASQKVGAKGRVIGVDMNDTMLALANKHRQTVEKAVGYANVEFRKGMIQDLALPVEDYEAFLKSNPVVDLAGQYKAEAEAERLRREKTLVGDGSIDVVVSNCVLNLVRDSDKKKLFREIFRVLVKGGRAVISDIVSDEVVPQNLRDVADLWSGCISGAWQEADFIRAFEDAGFYGITIVKRDAQPWQVVEGIEFRSVTIEATKGKEGPCLDRNQAVIYKGPWKAVIDDDGHTLARGELMAVCDKTYRIYTSQNGPYSDNIIGVEPRVSVPLDKAPAFSCRDNAIRDPETLKGANYKETIESDGPCCAPGECC